MATTMKGLRKGLKYISQIFDEEKEQEMQIGFPTNVKHVAHIGWDGPVVDSPSWMENFKTDRDSMSGPLGADDSSLRGSLHGSSPARDLPELPISSRRCSTNGDIFSMDSQREKPEKTSSKHSRKSKSVSGSKELSDNSSNRSSSARHQLLPESAMGSESPAHNFPDIPKRSRRKKSKDSSQGGSSKSSSRTAKAIAEASASASTILPSEPCSGSIPQLRNTDLDSCPYPNPQPLEEINHKKLNGFS